MNDQRLTGRIESLDIALQYISATQAITDAVLKQDCDPAGAHVLARSVLSALLAAASLGPDERLNVRWGYTGRLQTVLVDAGADGTVRGLIHPAHLSDALDVEDLYGGIGEIRVVRSRGGTVLSSGTVNACFMDVVDDLAAFLCISDQVESSAAAVVAFSDDPAHPVRTARGILLQALPDCDLEAFQAIRDRLRDPSVRTQLEQLEETDDMADRLLQLLLAGESATCVWTPISAPVFRCTCGPDKMDNAIRCLSYADRVDIVKKGEPVHLQCHFCNERYTLTVDDCIAAWNKKSDA